MLLEFECTLDDSIYAVLNSITVLYICFPKPERYFLNSETKKGKILTVWYFLVCLIVSVSCNKVAFIFLMFIINIVACHICM